MDPHAHRTRPGNTIPASGRRSPWRRGQKAHGLLPTGMHLAVGPPIHGQERKPCMAHLAKADPPESSSQENRRSAACAHRTPIPAGNRAMHTSAFCPRGTARATKRRRPASRDPSKSEGRPSQRTGALLAAVYASAAAIHVRSAMPRCARSRTRRRGCRGTCAGVRHRPAAHSPQQPRPQRACRSRTGCRAQSPPPRSSPRLWPCRT